MILRYEVWASALSPQAQAMPRQINLEAELRAEPSVTLALPPRAGSLAPGLTENGKNLPKRGLAELRCVLLIDPHSRSEGI